MVLLEQTQELIGMPAGKARSALAALADLCEGAGADDPLTNLFSTSLWPWGSNGWRFSKTEWLHACERVKRFRAVERVASLLGFHCISLFASPWLSQALLLLHPALW